MRNDRVEDQSSLLTYSGIRTRDFSVLHNEAFPARYGRVRFSLGEGHEATGFRQFARRRGGDLADRWAGAADRSNSPNRRADDRRG
jgi:hypothetical protein